MTGFKRTGLQIETSAATTAHILAGTTRMDAGVVWGIPTPLHSSVTTHVSAGRFTDVRTNVDPGLSTTECANHAAPNFQPSGVATLAGGQLAPVQPPNDGFFEAVTFIGAVPPAPAANWMDGWTSFPQN